MFGQSASNQKTQMTPENRLTQAKSVVKLKFILQTVIICKLAA